MHMLEFSSISKEYVTFRPRYPAVIRDAIFAYASTSKLKQAWDVATGNFQLANDIASKVDIVFANDISLEQLQAGIPANNVIPIHSASENIPEIQNNSIDLITCAQAIHWLDLPTFYNEVSRIAAPGAVIALPGYQRPRAKDSGTYKIIEDYYQGLSKYRDPRLAKKDSSYRSIEFPFSDQQFIEARVDFEYSAQQIVGYASSSEMVTRAIADTGINPLTKLADQLERHIGAKVIPMYQPFFCLLGRVVPR